jgi:hypothetical protein
MRPSLQGRKIAVTFWVGLIGQALLFVTTAHAQQKSTICKFDAGPRAGETQDYAPRPAIPVGSACQDGQGSTGVVISKQSPDAQKSTICKFDAGPRAGETQDYAPRPAIPVGSACQDGQRSTGVIISKQSPDDKSAQKSTICKFDAGPRAGETQDYAPRPAIPVGSACQDGQGSTGVVIAKQ